MEKWLNNNPELNPYRFGIEDLYRQQKHVLDEDKEKLLSYFSQFRGTPSDIYTSISTTDVKFPEVVLSGDDNLTLPLLATGGRGVISVVSNIFPRSTGEITRKFFNSDFAGAKKIFQTLFPFCNEMFVETNPIPVKYAASLLGLCKNELRLPMTPISESLRSGLKSKLEEIQKVLGEKP